MKKNIGSIRVKEVLNSLVVLFKFKNTYNMLYTTSSDFSFEEFQKRGFTIVNFQILQNVGKCYFFCFKGMLVLQSQ